MIRTAVRDALSRLQSEAPNREDLETLLSLTEPEEVSYLHETACMVRNTYCQERIALRALVEISSVCKNSCRYCGLNRYNREASRYTMREDEVLQSVQSAAKQGFRTVVLQSGENGCSSQAIAQLISEIKQQFPVAVTLSLGERPWEDYEAWKQAGADRYLLRIESTDEELYRALHTDRTLSSRMRCLEQLEALGYQVGSGIMVGLPGQSLSTIARDIQFFAKRQFAMIGIGPFIPHPQTPLAREKRGDLNRTLNTIALTRIVAKYPWMPATTALGSLQKDYRKDGLLAGANVIMPNFTPQCYKNQYAIYPNKQSKSESKKSLEHLAKRAGLCVDYGRCDSLIPGWH
ncbi:MAG: [FeFe] hydrogenase H-cluster radical SAM maturase HydE [Sphaerochaeta sp.]|nr:[FeFe] hydrogenase H-cluster radical SAM maturase HydE [Sphaerochaeta sp.]MDD4301944.1 [FeFe] hydrogenase H-cluster radical SAM maturase HydE [Sphaerochaeta sp.]MDD4647975.1 [FeFe] hydrogenase H-cluster radical SAM maturase HydE [Sphaerochaeta sp.]MDY0244091.1 [FeFe] hydrogenase H-cluster radical SAM maturase HydE [Sphaerochaeta sp.]